MTRGYSISDFSSKTCAIVKDRTSSSASSDTPSSTQESCIWSERRSSTWEARNTGPKLKLQQILPPKLLYMMRLTPETSDARVPDVSKISASGKEAGWYGTINDALSGDARTRPRPIILKLRKKVHVWEMRLHVPVPSKASTDAQGSDPLRIH